MLRRITTPEKELKIFFEKRKETRKTPYNYFNLTPLCRTDTV